MIYQNDTQLKYTIQIDQRYFCLILTRCGDERDRRRCDKEAKRNRERERERSSKETDKERRVASKRGRDVPRRPRETKMWQRERERKWQRQRETEEICNQEQRATEGRM